MNVGNDKKIAYLANVRFPSERAHSIQIAHMCQAFAETGSLVTLFCSRRLSAAKQTIEDQYGFTPLFSIKQLPPWRIYPSLRFTFYLGELLFTLAFICIGKPRNYDIFYTRSEWVAWILILLGYGTKVVWESHEARLTFPAKGILRRNVPVVVISEGIAARYREAGYTKQDYLVAHDAIDTSFFVPQDDSASIRARLDIPLKTFIVGYIGGLDTWKGVETLFKSAELLPDVQIVVIGGSGTEVQVWQKKYPDVQFLGHRPYQELPVNQKAMDVLVVPNTGTNKLSHSYTSPLKLFAHMASGIPLVLSDIPSLRSVVNEDLATFVCPDDPAALATGIGYVQAHYAQAIAKAKQLQKVAKGYTWQNRAKIILQRLHE